MEDNRKTTNDLTESLEGMRHDLEAIGNRKLEAFSKLGEALYPNMEKLDGEGRFTSERDAVTAVINDENDLKQRIAAAEHDLALQQQMASIEGKRVCQGCGSLLYPGDKFCGVCGLEIPKPRTCPNCQHEIEESMKFCPYCGGSLKD